MAQHDVIIVGGGHAGAQVAINLRQAGFGGGLCIINAEADLPYERPPLSKDYLAGDKPFERLLIRPASFWAERDVTMRLGRRVTAVDADTRTLTCDDGSAHGYGTLVWATGGAARTLPLPGGDAPNVLPIRTRGDSDAVRARLDDVQHVVVIGGGYIGLESAAILAKLGKSVTVIEALDRVLARVAGEPLSRFYEAEHRAHGVNVRLSTGVASVDTSADGRVHGVTLTDGTALPADLVIVGIGIIPEVAPLIAAGAAGGNGVDVDGWCRTSLPHVYAIGDCAAHANRFAAGQVIRLESVQNASDMAKVVAADIIGAASDTDVTGPAQPYDAVPWFWSNQYDLKLQTVGLSGGYDQTVLRGDPATRAFSLIYLKEGRVIALDCVNMVKDYVQGRKLVEGGVTADPAVLADTARPLKDLTT